MPNLIKTFLLDDTGATAIEYGLIVGLIAMALILGATAIGDNLDGIFMTAKTELDKA